MSERPFSQEGRTALVVAHRGASLREPENTLPAFEAAIAAGADSVEHDVRLSADGVPVVIHDATVDRTTDGHGRVADLDLAAIRRLRVRGDGAAGGASIRVPTLAEVLERCAGRVGVVVELKVDADEGAPPTEAPTEALAEAVAEAVFEAVGSAHGRVIAISFDHGVLERVRAAEKAIPTGLLTLPGEPAASALARAVEGGHAWVLPFVSVALEEGEGFATTAAAAGVRTAVWVVDDPSVALGLWRDGFDAVATNDPTAIADAREGAG
jgi:glycerophosphoryl diester phosphodiesterase